MPPNTTNDDGALNRSSSAELIRELERYDIELPQDAVVALDRYRHLLWDWNEKVNLTRHTDLTKFVTRDIFDSLQLATQLRADEEVVDLGTGGGVPGIILSIVRPDLQFSLCESVGKKARIVDQIVQQLELPVSVFHARLEDILDDFRFDAVVARAVGPLWKLCFWLQDHWLTAGRLLAIKGPNWPQERSEARHRGYLRNVELRNCHSYLTPGTDIESVILKLWGKGLTER